MHNPRYRLMSDLITAALFLEYFRIIYLFFSNMSIARHPHTRHICLSDLNSRESQWVTDNDASFNYSQSSFRMCMIQTA